MKGTILDFLKLAAEKPELAKALGELARRHDFEFSDEVSDAELDAVAGGGMEIPTDRPLTDEEQQQLLKEQYEGSMMQALSSIMKNQHDTLKQIIANMR